MGRGRKTEAEQRIDQVNRRGPSSQPTQTEPSMREEETGREGSVFLHV